MDFQLLIKICATSAVIMGATGCLADDFDYCDNILTKLNILLLNKYI